MTLLVDTLVVLEAIIHYDNLLTILGLRVG